MYKIFPVRATITAIVMLTLLANFVHGELMTYFPKFDWPAVPEAVSFLITILIARFWWVLWYLVPSLNHWVFPNLTGVWEVEMKSNWSRHQKTLEAASDAGQSFDIRTCRADALPLLMPLTLKAEIDHTFWTVHIRIWSEAADATIRESKVLSVEPYSEKGPKRFGLRYIYEQETDTDHVPDDRWFTGAASVEYRALDDTLTGTFWTDRVWRRAMNTAGEVRMRRVSKRISKKY